MTEQPRKIDLLKTIEPKSDQLNYDDMLAGPIRAKIVGLKAGTPDQPVLIVLEGQDRPYKPCKGMRRVLIALWGDKGKDWIGKEIELVGNPAVKWGGVEVGGIQVSRMSGIDGPQTLKLTASKGKRADYTVLPITEGQTK